MRSSLRAFVLAGALGLACCGEPEPGGFTDDPPACLAAAGVPGPVVLYPRHRILSPAPPIRLLVPGERGPVAIRLELRSGRTRIWRTRRRTLAWPAGWPGLAVGDGGWVTVRLGTLRCRSGFVRAPLEATPLAWRSAEEGVAWLLARGLPMEALLLAATDPGPGDRRLTQLLMRSGLPVCGLWHRP